MHRSSIHSRVMSRDFAKEEGELFEFTLGGNLQKFKIVSID